MNPALRSFQMNKTFIHVPALTASMALFLIAGCAEMTKTSARSPMVGQPELAGAWYQVYFTANDSMLDARAQMMVDSIAYAAVNSGDTRITVIGKADRTGTQSANMLLSHKRADRVRDALIADGVPAARIDTAWTGENRQDVTTADDVIEARNRVVDVTVSNKPR
jgi:outer membrane protein OmpA-like peptidoglycan-associated protein